MSLGVSNYPTSVDTAVELLDAVDKCTNALSSGISAVDTSLTLTDASLFPTTGGYVLIDAELIGFTGKSSNTLTGLTRGAGGTTAAIHSSGATVVLAVSSHYHDALRGAITNIETELGALPKGSYGSVKLRLDGLLDKTAGGTVTGNVIISGENVTNAKALRLTNLGAGATGLTMEIAGGGSITWEEMNSTPTYLATNKNIRFLTNSRAYDTGTNAYSFEALNKTATDVFMLWKGFSGQTGDFLQVKNSGATITHLAVSSTGMLTLRSDASSTYIKIEPNSVSQYAKIFMKATSGGEGFISADNSSAIGFNYQNSSAMLIGTANPVIWRVGNSVSAWGCNLTSPGNIRIVPDSGKLIYLDRRAFHLSPNTAPTDSDLGAGSITFYLDESGHNLKVRVKYADGTTLKTATVALV